MAESISSSVFSSLISSLSSSISLLPDLDDLSAPKDGISLLDIKNELFLSYLQNLVFLIVLKLREQKNYLSNDSEEMLNKDDRKVDVETNNDVVRKLVELRVYLEKGVKPLEGRLKYQIDKVVHAAESADISTTKRVSSAVNHAMIVKDKAVKRTMTNKNSNSDSENSASDSNASSSDSEESEEDNDGPHTEIDPLSYRPNPAALARPIASHSSRTADPALSNIYKPPRITPTTLPSTASSKTARAARPSATLSEFISTELSSAPIAEPSIGSTVKASGRQIGVGGSGKREREEDRERNNYEEDNYVRLPAPSKKERRQKSYRGREGYGGEDWKGLGDGADRVIGLVGGRKEGALERSRKRRIEDGVKGGQMGEGFEKRRRIVNKKLAKKSSNR